MDISKRKGMDIDMNTYHIIVLSRTIVMEFLLFVGRQLITPKLENLLIIVSQRTVSIFSIYTAYKQMLQTHRVVITR